MQKSASTLNRLKLFLFPSVDLRRLRPGLNERALLTLHSVLIPPDCCLEDKLRLPLEKKKKKLSAVLYTPNTMSPLLQP